MVRTLEEELDRQAREADEQRQRLDFRLIAMRERWLTMLRVDED